MRSTIPRRSRRAPLRAAAPTSDGVSQPSGGIPPEGWLPPWLMGAAALRGALGDLRGLLRRVLPGAVEVPALGTKPPG